MQRKFEVDVEGPARERTRMLSVRITPQEQRSIRVSSAMAGTPISALVRERLGDLLSPPHESGKQHKVKEKTND